MRERRRLRGDGVRRGALASVGVRWVEAEAVPAIRAELGDVVIATVAALPTSTVTGATGEGPEEAPVVSSGSEKADKEDKGEGEGSPRPHSNPGGDDDEPRRDQSVTES